MSENYFYTLQILSAFSIAPAIIASIQFTPKTGAIKLFVIFSLSGFIADMVGWFLLLKKNREINIYVQDFYHLLEPLILFWFIAKVSNNGIIKYIYARLWLVVIAVWPFTLFYKEITIGPYNATCQLLISFASCFCILSLVEKESDFSHHLIFWILVGMFFYFFSTFFIKAMLASSIAYKIWYVHNIINIVTNLIYFYGFLRVRKTMAV